MDTSFDIEPLIHGSMKKKLDIILTAPGINNPFTAIGIISEIGVNIEEIALKFFLSANRNQEIA